jgi:hypothetical protein
MNSGTLPATHAPLMAQTSPGGQRNQAPYDGQLTSWGTLDACAASGVLSIGDIVPSSPKLQLSHSVTHSHTWLLD